MLGRRRGESHLFAWRSTTAVTWLHPGPIPMHLLPIQLLSICGELCNVALSLSKYYFHLRLLLDFNMRLCVTLVSSGKRLQSRMKIYRNNIIVYTPVYRPCSRGFNSNEYSDVALRTVRILNNSYRGVAQTSNASASFIYFVLLTLEKPWLTLLNTSHITRLFDFSTIKPMYWLFRSICF